MLGMGSILLMVSSITLAFKRKENLAYGPPASYQCLSFMFMNYEDFFSSPTPPPKIEKERKKNRIMRTSNVKC